MSSVTQRPLEVRGQGYKVNICDIKGAYKLLEAKWVLSFHFPNSPITFQFLSLPISSYILSLIFPASLFPLLSFLPFSSLSLSNPNPFRIPHSLTKPGETVS